MQPAKMFVLICIDFKKYIDIAKIATFLSKSGCLGFYLKPNIGLLPRGDICSLVPTTSWQIHEPTSLICM